MKGVTLPAFWVRLGGVRSDQGTVAVRSAAILWGWSGGLTLLLVVPTAAVAGRRRAGWLLAARGERQGLTTGAPSRWSPADR